MRKIIINVCIIIFLFSFLQEGKTQQLPLLNQDRMSLNPALISSTYFKYNTTTNAAISYRHQWTKVEGAPRTIFGSFTHYDEDNRLSFGGDFTKDETGPTGFIGFNARANYNIPLGGEFVLAGGLSGGLTQYRVQGKELNFLESGDLASNNATKIFPDFSFGAMLYWNENYYIGFSIPQLFSLDLTFKDENGDYNLQRIRHYYGLAGGRFEIRSDTWIEGSVEARYIENVPFYLSGKVDVEFRQLFWVNAAMSSSKEIGIGLGIIANIGNNLARFGYSFSNHFQRYGADFGTVHELGFQYNW